MDQDNNQNSSQDNNILLRFNYENNGYKVTLVGDAREAYNALQEGDVSKASELLHVSLDNSNN